MTQGEDQAAASDVGAAAAALLQRLGTRPAADPNACPHAPQRVYTWWAWNYQTGKDDILCAACCDCGAVLAGGAELEAAGITDPAASSSAQERS